MIDIHTHILNGVDDGSRSLNESVEMVKMAYADGIDTICLTSHIKPPSYKNTKMKLMKRYMELKMECFKQGIPVRLVFGAENHLHYDTVKDIDTFITYADKRKYILIEFPYYRNMYDHFTRFLIKVKERGYIPVIAHPERYQFVWYDYSFLTSWKKMGCLLQVNRTSVLGFDPNPLVNETTKRMLEDNLVDIIASDAHRKEGMRIPVLSDVYTYIEETYGKERAELYLTINPNKVIE